MRVVGVDNGHAGGLVLLENGIPTQRHVMPIIELKKGKSTKHEYDIPQIVRLFKQMAPEHVFIEKAQAMPMQGTVSCYQIGVGFGVLLGVVTALEIPHTRVHPKTWGREMFRDLPKQDTKAMAFLVCGRLWPSIDWRATDRCKKFHTGLVDAAMIAAYGSRVLGGLREEGL